MADSAPTGAAIVSCREDGEAEQSLNHVPDEKATAPDEKAIAPDEKATAPDEKATAPDEKATAPDEKATGPDEKADTNCAESLTSASDGSSPSRTSPDQSSPSRTSPDESSPSRTSSDESRPSRTSPKNDQPRTTSPSSILLTPRSFRSSTTIPDILLRKLRGVKTVERACELLDSLNSAILQIDQIPTTNPSVATAIYVCVLRGKLQLCDTIDDAKNILNYLKLCALFQAVGFSQLPVPFVACVLSSLFSTSGLDSSVNVDANGSSSASEHHAHADTSSVMDVMDAKVEKLDGGSDASFPYPIFSVDRDGWTIFHWAVAVGAVGLDAAGKSLFPRGDVGSISDSRRTTTDSLFDVILRKATTSGEHLVALENDAGESPFIMALYASDLVAVRKIVNSPGFSVAMYRPSDFASVLESTSAEEVRQCLLKLCLARSETIEEARSFIAEIQFDFSALNISNLMMELTGCESDDVLFGLDKNLIPFRAVLERCDFLAKVDEMDINMMPPDESDRARTIFELAVHAADDTLVNIILNLFGAKVVLLNSSGISILRDAIDACCEKCVRAILCKHPEGVKHLSDMVFYIEGENETNVEVTPLEYVRKKYGMKSGRMVQIIEDALLAARMIEVVSESDATEAVKSGATRAASAMTLAATLRDEREAEQKKYEERITNVVREAREDGSKFCNICIEKIPNRVIITCGHVFCETCLADMPPPRSLSKRSYKPVHCPTCKQKFYNWSVNEKRDVASAQVPQGSNGAIEKRCGSVMKIYF